MMSYIKIALAVVIFFAGFGVAWKIQDGRYYKREAALQAAATKALIEALAKQKAYTDIALDEAKKQADTQSALAEEARNQRTEVVRYVNVPVQKVITRSCIPYGLVRVLADAASGSAKRLPVPSGKSDESCAPIDWPAFAGWIADNFAIARANSAQLTGWQEWWTRVKPTANENKVVSPAAGKTK